MKATRPVDGDVCSASAQLASGGKGRSGIQTAKIEHVCEDGAILDAIEVVDQMSHVVLVTGSDPRSQFRARNFVSSNCREET
jgi:hypothetical protein